MDGDLEREHELRPTLLEWLRRFFLGDLDERPVIGDSTASNASPMVPLPLLSLAGSVTVNFGGGTIAMDA